MDGGLGWLGHQRPRVIDRPIPGKFSSWRPKLLGANPTYYLRRICYPFVEWQSCCQLHLCPMNCNKQTAPHCQQMHKVVFYAQCDLVWPITGAQCGKCGKCGVLYDKAHPICTLVFHNGLLTSATHRWWLHRLTHKEKVSSGWAGSWTNETYLTVLGSVRVSQYATL